MIQSFKNGFREIKSLDEKLDKTILEKETLFQKEMERLKIKETSLLTLRKMKHVTDILNLLKIAYEKEQKTEKINTASNSVNTEFQKKNPLYDIIKFLRKQVIVKRFTSYSIQYIRLVNGLSKENITNLIQKNINQIQQVRTGVSETTIIREIPPPQISSSSSSSIPFIPPPVYIASSKNDQYILDIILRLMEEYGIEHVKEQDTTVHSLLLTFEKELKKLMYEVINTIHDSKGIEEQFEKVSSAVKGIELK